MLMLTLFATIFFNSRVFVTKLLRCWQHKSKLCVNLSKEQGPVGHPTFITKYYDATRPWHFCKKVIFFCLIFVYHLSCPRHNE